MASNNSTLAFQGEPLIGRSNYIEWLNKATLFLEINGYMSYIKGIEKEPERGLYYNSSGQPYSPELAIKYIDSFNSYTRGSLKALGAIKAIISLENQERFRDKEDPQSLWQAITDLYGEGNFEILGRYLDKLIDADSSKFESIDLYTSQVQSSAFYLRQLGYEIPIPLIA